MAEPYEPLNLRRRYHWSAACRESERAFYPTLYGQPFRWKRGGGFHGGYRPRRHATQEWWGGERYFRTNHWRMREPQVGLEGRSAQGLVAEPIP
jgi:hypothetical protein